MNQIADARHYQASSIATRMLMNTDSARTSHPHATALLLSGVPVHVVSRRLGHADVQTTLSTYAHVTEDAEMRAAGQWQAFTAGWRVGVPGGEQIGHRS